MCYNFGFFRHLITELGLFGANVETDDKCYFVNAACYYFIFFSKKKRTTTTLYKKKRKMFIVFNAVFTFF